MSAGNQTERYTLIKRENTTSHQWRHWNPGLFCETTRIAAMAVPAVGPPPLTHFMQLVVIRDSLIKPNYLKGIWWNGPSAGNAIVVIQTLVLQDRRANHLSHCAAPFIGYPLHCSRSRVNLNLITSLKKTNRVKFPVNIRLFKIFSRLHYWYVFC